MVKRYASSMPIRGAIIQPGHVLVAAGYMHCHAAQVTAASDWHVADNAWMVVICW